MIRLRDEGQEGEGLHDLAALGAGQLHPAVHADIGINPGDLQEVFDDRRQRIVFFMGGSFWGVGMACYGV